MGWRNWGSADGGVIHREACEVVVVVVEAGVGVQMHVGCGKLHCLGCDPGR